MSAGIRLCLDPWITALYVDVQRESETTRISNSSSLIGAKSNPLVVSHFDHRGVLRGSQITSTLSHALVPQCLVQIAIAYHNVDIFEGSKGIGQHFADFAGVHQHDDLRRFLNCFLF